MAGVGGNAAVEIRPVKAGERVAIEAAIQLSKVGQATLGIVPFAKYEEAASKGRLIVAEIPDGSVVGFALFDIARQRVRLVQVCVDPSSRRSGVARRLIEWISERNRDRAGILVSCRLDYGLREFWSKLGFQRMSERRGRGRKRTTLVIWWRDHGQPSLFANLRDGVLVRASIDLNVLRDLAEPGRATREESLALHSDQLDDQLQLVRTRSLDVEVDALGDTERHLAASEAQTLPSLHPATSEVALIETALRAAADAADPAFLRDVSNERDVQYVSEAAAAGLSVFVTKDERLAHVLGEAASLYGVRILRPSEVVVRIDELARSEAYRPGPLQSTSFTRSLISSDAANALEAFVSRSSKERRSATLARLRLLSTRGYERVGIFDTFGELAGVYFIHAVGDVLDVPILRVRSGPIAATLTRQVLLALRREALAKRTSAIRLVDPYLDRATASAAVDDGFIQSDNGLVALVIDVVGTAAEVTSRTNAAAASAAVPPPFTTRSDLLPVPAAEVERVFWPAKVLDSRLPTYILPIQQQFSRELLGAPLTLFARDPGLGLSREHVYFRSPRGTRLAAPARLVWYMSESAKGSIEPAAVVAVSLLEEVVEGAPGDLHDRFRHLGAWRSEQVDRAARDGTAQALRFTYTETFAQPVSGSVLAQELGTPPQGPRHLSSEAFGRLYRRGHGHG